jgi:RNA polymerase sigma-70 factor (ECF subfamily)
MSMEGLAIMFFSTAIPGILHAESLSVLPIHTDKIEKVRACMTVEETANQQRGMALPSDMILLKLYEQYRRPIHSYTYRLLGNREDADDVTQEVFVRACSSWENLYEHERLSAWLYRIATNLCVDHLRRRKRISWWPLSRRSRSDEAGDEPATDDFAGMLADSGGIPEVAERELIQQTLADMPQEYAVALVLHAAQGVSYQDIAEIVGVSPNAAATRISRAKKIFAEKYQQMVLDGGGKREIGKGKRGSGKGKREKRR